MVTVLPQENNSDAIFKNLGTGISEGYMNRADQTAIQNAIRRLPPDASARDILNAITNTSTYNNAAKQQVLQNYIGVSEFEELQKKAREQAGIRKRELDMEEQKHQLKKAEEEKKKLDAKNSALEFVKNSKIPEEHKQKLVESISADRLLPEDAKQLIKENKDAGKKEEKIQAAEGALKTVQEMREIRKKGKLGLASPFTRFLDKEIAKDYGQYQQLGKSLIQFATNIPIRNRQEFQVLAEKLYDPATTDAEAEGILDALESIIKRGSSLEGPSGKVRVRNKQTGKTGTVTPFEGMESKYELLR